MNSREIEILLLLQSSGELTDAQARELEAALAENPDAASLLEEQAVLRQAGRFASVETVPPMSDTGREALLRKAGGARRGPGPWLALAALLVIGLALWPHLPFPSPEATPATDTLTQLDPAPDTPVLEDDPVLADLEELNREMRSLSDITPADLLEPDADFWAEQLLAMEDS